jgi:PPOX class probable F420-dependent enzyme
VTRSEILEFLRAHRLCVLATTSPDGQPQAAVVGYGVSDDLEIVFDTLSSTRKCENLRRDARVALVIGWDDERTVQIEGHADFPMGAELARIRDCYFAAYPEGRDRLKWAGITHVRVRPTWLRYSDFGKEPARVDEMTASALG